MKWNLASSIEERTLGRSERRPRHRPAWGGAPTRSWSNGWSPIASVAILVGVGLAVPPARAAGDLEGARIELHAGAVLRGTVRQIQPSLYLVQTEDDLYELSAPEILSVNGEAGTKAIPAPESPVLKYETFEDVEPNGDVQLWSAFETTNETSKIWTDVRWAVKAHEREMQETLQAFDSYGQRLENHLEPRTKGDLLDQIIDLRVPIIPGEPIHLSVRYLQPGRATPDGDGYRFTFNGDFPDDRIFTRKVLLPAGAVVESIDPEPLLELEYQDRELIVWRRYYPAGLNLPLSVRYRIEK